MLPTLVDTRPPFPGHLKPLDGIRGLAILMVICSHAFQSNSQANGAMARAIGIVLSYGVFGVDLFFVLSGFLITGILVDTIAGEGYFRRFYARRILRIFPLYYAVLLLLLLLTPLLHLHWHGMGWLLFAYLQNMRPGQLAVFDSASGLQLGHFWSLAVEEQFYLVWPAVVYLVRDRTRLLSTTLILSAITIMVRLVLVFMGASHVMIYVSTFTRADALLLGGTLSLLFRSQYWSQVQKRSLPGLLLTSTLVVGSIFVLGADYVPHPPTSLGARLWIDGCRYTILALGAASLIAWSLKQGSLGEWFFTRKSLCFFGRYSYGIYVLHLIALPYLVTQQRQFILHFTHSKMLAVAGAGLLTLALAVFAAYLSFNYFEKPILNLKHRFDYIKK